MYILKMHKAYLPLATMTSEICTGIIKKLYKSITEEVQTQNIIYTPQAHSCKVGVVWHVLKHLEEELAWATEQLSR